MNPPENKTIGANEIDASCRVPLLALFGGAALWLVLGLAARPRRRDDVSQTGPVCGLSVSDVWPRTGGGERSAALRLRHARRAGCDALDFRALEPGTVGAAVGSHRRREPLASWRFYWHNGDSTRRKHRPSVAGISARGGGFTVRRIHAGCGKRGGDDGFPAESRDVSVALVFVHRAAVVCVELRNGEFIFNFRPSAARRGAGGDRLVV